MIALLHGILERKTPTEILLVVNGVGYSVSIPLSTFEALGETSREVTVLTHLHVREDALQLFGFATEAERSTFRLLISVSGIGPKVALGILSGIPVTDLKSHIATGDIASLTQVPGVGRKLAERLVLELREKISKSDDGEGQSTAIAQGPAYIRSEALLALTSLGYNRPAAEKALRAALQEIDGHSVAVEDLVKTALRHATKSQ
jgi:Holliday junction DNA helicase RuvA